MNPTLLRTPQDVLLVEVDEGTFPLLDAWIDSGSGARPPVSVDDLLADDALHADRLAALARSWKAAGRPFDPAPEILAPPIRPRKILALGRNYAAHAREMGSTPAVPFFFAKLPSCCVGHGAPIVIPRDLDGDVHHEVELAVLIGRTGRRIPVGRALEHVAGYAVINDVTARGLQAKAKEKGKPWTSAKNLDSFAPLGPGLVPADAVADVADLAIVCRVNGEVRQQGSTGDMLLPIPETIAHLSRHLTLEAGDLIATGTPAGVGLLRPGDTVECEVDGIGRLVNPVRED